MTRDQLEAARKMREALEIARRAIDHLMPGVGGLAISAEQISDINMACILGDRALSAASAAGIGDGE